MNPKFTPGFISVLHTFGRDLKWNPHIHCLISEGGLSNDNFWRKVPHFNYTLLRNSFCTALLNELHSKLGNSFKSMKSLIYNHCKNSFYDSCKTKSL
ncbi:MAG: transposase [Blautia wexlerae]